MLANYFRLAWRHFVANKTVSLINTFGLSIAVASCISVFLFLQNFWTMDNFHVNGERIFIVEYVVDANGEVQIYGDAPAPLAAALVTEFPQVERAVRIQREGVKLFNKENVLEEVLTYADLGFFSMFTFPLQSGDPAALSDPNAIILSDKMAVKYFGDESPIGRTLSLVHENQEIRQFTVQGVAAPFPNNAGFAFSFLTGYHPVHAKLKAHGWDMHTNGLFIQLREPQDAEIVAQQLGRYVSPFDVENPDVTVKSFVLDNLRDPAPGAYDVYRRPAEANHPLLTVIFGLIALTMLALSCFNYVNISLGSVSRRLKEIGMRKVMGGRREQLVVQFMTENLLLCFISLFFGVMLTETLFLPLLNSTMVMKTSLLFSENIGFWLMLIGLLVLTAVASGAYPAFYVSSFKPVVIFTGRQKFARQNILRRSLLIGQFALAFLAVIVTVVLLTAAQYWEELSWGYNPNQTMVVRLTDSQQFHLLKNELIKDPGVLQIAGSMSHVGQSFSREIVHIGDEKQNVLRFDVGADYQQTLGLDLSAGRFFETSRGVEDERAIIVNETFAAEQGWDEPVGKTFRIGTTEYTVIGMVGDFKILGTGATRPVVFLRANETDFRYLIARFVSGSAKSLAAHVEEKWNSLFPNVPVSYFFQKEIYNSFFSSFRRVSQSFGYIAGLMLIIACLGLYGLASQHFSRRVKEVGVRKMLGASVAHILLLVNREFIVLLLVAGIASTTLSFIGIQVLAQNARQFVGDYSPSLATFMLANLIVFLTAAVAVGRQSWNTTRVNLSEVLKNSE